MRRLSAADMLRVWEWGEGRHPIDQSLAILAAGFPETNFDALARLSIGEREARLLQLREMTAGAQMEGFAECPNCGSALEFVLDGAALRASQGERGSGLHEVEAEGFRASIRLPNSYDLAAAVQAGSPEAARLVLLERTVEKLQKDGALFEPAALPEAAAAALGEKAAALDPLAETILALQCSVCEHRWTLLFDVTAFFWREIRARARQLLGEVHVLARAYGWSEADILALPARRRRRYIEMVL